MATKQMNFEQAMSRLEEIVGLLERGEEPLETSLALFEEVTKLMRQCSVLLDKAEQTVTMLKVDMSGRPTEAPFDTEEEQDEL